MKNYKNIFKYIGIFALAIIVANVNACGKKGSSRNSNPYYPYGGGGFVGGGVYGSGIGQTPDGAILSLQFMLSGGQNAYQAAAQGLLIVPPQGLVGCAIPPGQYSLNTVAPGVMNGGDQFSNIQMQSNSGFPAMINSAILFSQVVQNPYAGVSHQMFAAVNIPGCPLFFN